MPKEVATRLISASFVGQTDGASQKNPGEGELFEGQVVCCVGVHSIHSVMVAGFVTRILTVLRSSKINLLIVKGNKLTLIKQQIVLK